MEKITKEQINKIHALCIDINSLEERRYGNGPTAFYYFSGHISLVRVSVHNNGWKTGSEADIMFSIYTDQNHVENIIECERCIKYLEGIKEVK